MYRQIFKVTGTAALACAIATLLLALPNSSGATSPGGFSGLTSSDRARVACYPALPAPQLVVTETEYYVFGGQATHRYKLAVINHEQFPDELFEAAPDLPPCGLNPNASRTWVDVYAQSGSRLGGFCSLVLGSADLETIWFASAAVTPPPDLVYVTLHDRRCDLLYTSNLANTATDFDQDSVLDVQDNCVRAANLDQRDTDGDGLGNVCDADFTDDCFVNFDDLGELKTNFFAVGDTDYDLDGNGVANFADLLIMREIFFSAPGPSGIPNLCEEL